MVDTIHTATFLEHNPTCHQDIHLAILSPPLPRAASTRCFLHPWRHRGCVVHRHTSYRYLSVPPNTLLLAKTRPGLLHPNDQLLYHSCLLEPRYRCRRSDLADSSHLVDTNPKEQEALALCGVLAWLNVRYALTPKHPRSLPKGELLSKLAASVSPA